MVAVQIVGAIMMVTGLILLVVPRMGSESKVIVPGVTIDAPASVLVLLIGVAVFLFPYSPWWPSSTNGPQSAIPSLAPASATPRPSLAQTPNPTLASGDFLDPGATRMSANGRYLLQLTTGGDLVLIREDTVSTAAKVWEASARVPKGTPGKYVWMQTDGNLVLYKDAGPPVSGAIWSSATNGHPNAALIVQDDGNLVLSAPDGTVLWTSQNDGGCHLAQQECSSNCLYHCGDKVGAIGHIVDRLRLASAPGASPRYWPGGEWCPPEWWDLSAAPDADERAEQGPPV